MTAIAISAKAPAPTSRSLPPIPPRRRWRRRLRCVIEQRLRRPARAQACVSSVEWLWTTPSTSSWLGMTKWLPSPGSM